MRMSMITVLLTGTLTQNTSNRHTEEGDAMCTVTLSVDVGDEKPAFISLLTFDEDAYALAELEKGDTVSVRGWLQLNRWTAPEGESREQWEVVADAFLAGPGRPTIPTRERPAPYACSARFKSPEPPPFDEEDPF